MVGAVYESLDTIEDTFSFGKECRRSTNHECGVGERNEGKLDRSRRRSLAGTVRRSMKMIMAKDRSVSDVFDFDSY